MTNAKKPKKSAKEKLPTVEVIVHDGPRTPAYNKMWRRLLTQATAAQPNPPSDPKEDR